MSRLRSAAAAAIVALLAAAVLAQAASIPKPPTGAWKLVSPGIGFTLKHGKGRKSGKIFVSNLRAKTQPYSGCPSKSTKIRLLGRYPLRKFTRGGYTSWGVGKNVAGDVGPRPGRVRVGGKTYNGKFYLVWDYSDPRETIGGTLDFRSCVTGLSFGVPK